MTIERVCKGCGTLYEMQNWDWPKNFNKRQFCGVACRARNGPKRAKRPTQSKACVGCGTLIQRGKIGQARWDARTHCGNACKSRGRPRDTYWNVTHGRSDDPVYKVWTSMKQRCTNSKHPQWHRYGGRGIGVCQRRNRRLPAVVRFI